MMSKNGFSRCGEIYIGRLRKEGRYSTAHVYKNALLSFSLFCGTFNVSFRQVTRERLRRYGQYLYECGLKPNTVSTSILENIAHSNTGSTDCYCSATNNKVRTKFRKNQSVLFITTS